MPAGHAWRADSKCQHNFLQGKGDVANTRESRVSMQTNGDEGQVFGAREVLKHGIDSDHAKGRSGAARGRHTIEFCAAVHQAVH